MGRIYKGKFCSIPPSSVPDKKVPALANGCSSLLLYYFFFHFINKYLFNFFLGFFFFLKVYPGIEIVRI